MRKLKYLFLFASVVGYAQINTDRPSQSFSSVVMPKGGFQIESGFIYEKPVSGEDPSNLTWLTNQFRFGLLDKLELRLSGDFKGSKGAATADVNGIGPTTIGTKIHLFDGTAKLPQMGLLASYTFTNGDRNFSPNDPIKDIRILFQNGISDKLSLAYNVGMFWEGDGAATGIYTVILGISTTDKLSLFVEPYGFFGDAITKDHRINGGFTYLVADHFQLDGSGGVGLSRSSPDYFMGFGGSILF